MDTCKCEIKLVRESTESAKKRLKDAEAALTKLLDKAEADKGELAEAKWVDFCDLCRFGLPAGSSQEQSSMGSFFGIRFIFIFFQQMESVPKPSWSLLWASYSRRGSLA